MSWHFSQALVAAYSAANSLDGEPSVPSKSTPTPLAYLCSDRMTAFSTRSLSGMIFVPLTADLGADVLTWFLAGFPAKTSVQRAKALELEESEAAFGLKCEGSFARYDPASSSWKTHQCLLLGGLELFSETWPRWGLMRDGECWERSTLAPPTSGNESGLWLTPRVVEIDETPEKFRQRMNSKRQNDRKNGFGNLTMQVKATFPTPTRSDHKGSGPTMMRKDGKLRGDRLDYALERNLDGTSTGGQLNPPWVEWLMGWPLGWTDLKPLGTDKFQQWLNSHGKF